MTDLVATPAVPWWRRGLARRALTRPLWWWQKRRPWPIRGKVLALPPHPVARGETATRLIMQFAPGSLTDAAWAAYSFLRQLDRPEERLGLTVYVDTTDARTFDQSRAPWEYLFEGVEVRRAREPLERLQERAPALAAWARTNPIGRKLAVLLDAQERSHVLYADSDVLLFGPAPELADAVRHGGPPRFNLEDGGLNGDARLVAYARRAGWPAPASLNSGLLFIPRGTLRLGDAERLLASGEFDPASWFVEQTALALLLTAAGAAPLPPERYVVSTAGQFYGETDLDYARIVTRHFTTPVRHLMYAKGLPLLLRNWSKESP